MRQYQTGATLIIVLIFLILIISVGAIAVRQSVTDLKVATNDQVDALLMNTSDSVPSYFEEAINEGKQEYVELIGALGPFGYFMNVSGAKNRGDQIIFCYNPRKTKIFAFNEATVLTPDNGSKIVGGSGTGGYCNSAESDNYTSARNTTMVQVMLTRPDSSSTPAGAFDGVALGRDANVTNVSSAEPLFALHSASLLPALSNVTDATISECLKNPSVQANRFKDSSNANVVFEKTLSSCLEAKGVPSKVIVEEIRMRNINVSSLCIGFGTGNGVISDECAQTFGLTTGGTLVASSN